MSVGTGSVKAEPNVVPMIDVMLVLLIIFMVTIPALAAGFTANPPTGINLKSHPEEDTDQVLGIDNLGNYYLNKRPISIDTLGATLQRIYANRDDRVLYIKADKELLYGKITTAWTSPRRTACASWGRSPSSCPARNPRSRAMRSTTRRSPSSGDCLSWQEWKAPLAV
jgi:biopolymer transport protein ExbD